MNVIIQNFYTQSYPCFCGKKINITKEQILALRKQGKLETEIPEILGVSRTAYYRNLKKLGLSTVHSEFNQKLAEISKDEFEQMLKDKVAIEDICKKFGITTNAYYLYIQRYNLRNYIVGASRKAVTKEQLQELVDKKVPIEEICKILNISASAYYALLQKLNVITEFKAHKLKAKSVTKEQLESLMNSGKNNSEICEQLGISQSTLLRLIIDFKIDTKILQTKKIVSTVTKEQIQALIDSGKSNAEICEELKIPVRTYVDLTNKFGIVTKYRQAKKTISNVSKEELQQLVDAGYTRKEICEILDLSGESTFYRLLKSLGINYPYQHHINEIKIPKKNLQRVVEEWESIQDIQEKLNVSISAFYQKSKAAKVKTVLSDSFEKLKSADAKKIQEDLDNGATRKEICDKYNLTPNLYKDLVRLYGLISKTKKKSIDIQSITKKQLENLILSGKRTKEICKELDITVTTYMKLLKKYDINRDALKQT